MRVLTILFFLYSAALNGAESRSPSVSNSSTEVVLKNKLTEAHAGSYLVIEQNKTFTFFHIHDRSENAVIIEEVSIPTACFSRRAVNWKRWFESGAPGHTSWIISRVNLATGVFEETFSFTHQGWIDMSKANPFLTTLLNLHFKEVPATDRRKIGIPPGYHKTDLRPVWNPRLTVDGQIIPHAPFFAYKARWPSDGSDLARKIVEIYLPALSENETTDLWCPAYFPYWLEVDGKIGNAKARVIDSGMDACSPKPFLPKRSPQLMGIPKVVEEGLLFKLQSPLYYREFLILAEEVDPDTFFDKTFPLRCEATYEGEIVSLFVSEEELNKQVRKGADLRFMIFSKEDPDLCVETHFSLKSSLL